MGNDEGPMRTDTGTNKMQRIKKKKPNQTNERKNIPMHKIIRDNRGRDRGYTE